MSLPTVLLVFAAAHVPVGVAALVMARMRRTFAPEPPGRPRQPLFVPVAAPPIIAFSGQRQPGLLCLVTGIPPDSCTCPAHERPTP